MESRGCNKKILIGCNKVLECPINAQCGVSRNGNEIVYCKECLQKTSSKEGGKGK